MKDKKTSRMRRLTRTRAKIRELESRPRLSVHRSNNHIYAQLVDVVDNNILAAASTLEDRGENAKTGNVAAAAVVGKRIAERALDKGVKQVAFDRAGFKYHGRIKALADAAREAGVEF